MTETGPCRLRWSDFLKHLSFYSPVPPNYEFYDLLTFVTSSLGTELCA